MNYEQYLAARAHIAGSIYAGYLATSEKEWDRPVAEDPMGWSIEESEKLLSRLDKTQPNRIKLKP